MAALEANAAVPEKKAYKFSRVTAYDGGIGAYATRPIKRGEVILREPPILRTTMEALERDAAGLDDTSRKRLFSLCDWRAEREKRAKTALGIFRANGYPAPRADGSEGAGVFLAFSRFNHSCGPNVHHAWYPGADEKVVYAARDVEAGEELLTNYVDLFAPRAERRAALAERFGFDCACPRCGLRDPSASDARRRRLSALDESVFEHTRRGRYAEALRDAEARIAALTEEGLDSPANLVRTCHDAYQASAHSGASPEATRKWLRRVLDHSRQCEPPGSDELARLTAELAKL